MRCNYSFTVACNDLLVIHNFWSDTKRCRRRSAQSSESLFFMVYKPERTWGERVQQHSTGQLHMTFRRDRDITFEYAAPFSPIVPATSFASIAMNKFSYKIFERKVSQVLKYLNCYWVWMHIEWSDVIIPFHCYSTVPLYSNKILTKYSYFTFTVTRNIK